MKNFNKVFDKLITQRNFLIAAILIFIALQISMPSLKLCVDFNACIEFLNFGGFRFSGIGIVLLFSSVIMFFLPRQTFKVWILFTIIWTLLITVVAMLLSDKPAVSSFIIGPSDRSMVIVLSTLLYVVLSFLMVLITTLKVLVKK
jgi:hypothetical protein